MRTRFRPALPVMALLASAMVALPAPALAGGDRVIRVTTTIQAAVDAAMPGDTVLVPPGTYRESVLIDKSDLTLRGSRGAEIDAHGFTNGITVGTGEETPGPDGFPVCPPLALRNVTVEGLTVRNAEDNGIFMIGVDGFQVRGGRYLDNHEYGVFPRCSTHGAIEGSLAEGANDTGIYVGNDTEVTVTGNRATGNTSGFEVENSSDVVVRGNRSSGNTAGILVFVLPGLPRTATDHVLVEGNVVTRNNRPNPVPPDSGEDLGLVPTGSGILDIAGDDVTFRRRRLRRLRDRELLCPQRVQDRLPKRHHRPVPLHLTSHLLVPPLRAPTCRRGDKVPGEGALYGRLALRQPTFCRSSV